MTAARDRRAQRDVAARAADNATQGKLIPDVLARRRLRFARAAFLDLFEDLEGNEALMLSLEPADPVLLRTDVPGIDGMGQDVGDTALRDEAVLVAREVWEALEETFDLRLGLEPTACVAFERFPNDPIEGRVWHEHFPSTFEGLHPETHRRDRDPEA
ncbi:MAG: hypothetical protein AAGG09_00620 [Pseudomonadota bacterium]